MPYRWIRCQALVASTLFVVFLAAGAGWSDDKQPDEPKTTEKTEKDKKEAKGKTPKAGEPKKYEEVITAKAKTTHGVFTVHRIDDKVYFEIPASAYGKLMLWSAEVAKAPPGVGWGGKAGGKTVVRWDRRGNKVFLWQVAFEKRGDGKAVQHAVESANLATILHSFPVEAENKNKDAVIHVTSLFTADNSELSIKRAVPGAGAIDDSRTYLEEIKTFPTNIETRVLLTYRGTGGAAGGGAPVPAKLGGGGAGGKSVSVLAHYSLTLLPDKPMTGRYFDPRVGYFTRSFEDYSGDKTWMVKRQYIARFRLEKKDKDAEVSEPVKPIVFYLSREVPERWRPYMKKGVEDWLPAFEKAGFKNAIFCKDAPTKEEDPQWDAEDARYSVIRWVADPTQNAMGPHVHDPRSGEIISAHIIFWHDIQKLVQQWYFVQCAAVDPRANKLPLPDEVTGECLRYVAAHEVGHTLGLRHNHRASSAYTVAQLRDPAFTDKYGTVASIMAYGRFNYVAQPGDKVTSLIPKIGPYDIFAIEWGYKPIAGVSDPHKERPELDSWAAKQLDEPWLRFGGEDGPAAVDPTVKTENISTDALEATALGLKNLDRVIDMLPSATTELGEDFSLMQETYKTVLTHRRNWFNAVALLIGGVVENRTLGGRGSETFTRVPKDKQRAAVKFLTENAFTTPRNLLQPALVNRFKYYGIADDIMGQQKALLESLLSNRRFKLLMDGEVLDPDGAYTALQFMTDIQDAVWSELKDKQPTTVDVLRRNLQRAYLEILRQELTRKESAAKSVLALDDGGGNRGTDFRGVARAALQRLAGQLDAVIRTPSAQPRPQEAITEVHWRDCRREIEFILSPKN
jgi:hypothetical protein